MTRKEKVRFLIIRSLGNFLLLMSLYGVAATFGPVIEQEVRFRLDTAKGVKYVVSSEAEVTKTEQPDKRPKAPGLLGSVFDRNTERIIIPPDTSFSIVIPKIGASSRIIANIDPENYGEFQQALLQGVAHAKGTVFPGYAGNTYLFAHSADNWWEVGRYNAIFYLIKDLEPGDEIIVFFENRRYNYIVKEKLIADPSDVSLLTQNRGSTEKLILQTCWPPGTTWKRLFVVAEPKTSKL